ncbi:MAG: hypothetical protein Q7W55_13650 [Pseudohongiella sp.]|nr:hypothetical protein [Pseudohongiella sp.]
MRLKEVVQRVSTARAEFHSTNNSVFGRFVVPPYIDTFNISKIDQSMAVVGGRGCGKTTYVRYFSHWTQFDPLRETIDPEALNCIVLYWKPDTTYFRSLTKSWLSEKNSRAFFHALSGLHCFKELVCCLENISSHIPELGNELALNVEFWRRVARITEQNVSSLKEISGWIDDCLFDVEMSINANDDSRVVRIDAKAMFELLLPSLQEGCSIIARSRFKIFVDEFENLAEYQQIIINSYRKHSSALISWNVAHKRFATLTSETDGDENLQHGNDYREFILDEGFAGGDEDFEKKFFLCELLVLSLIDAGLICTIGNLDAKTLGDPSCLYKRKEKGYRAGVQAAVKKILDTPSIRDLARIAIEKKAVLNLTKQALSSIKDLPEEYISVLISDRPDVALATILISTQNNFKTSDLVSYIEGGFATTNPYNQRVQTYLYSSMLNLNARYSYISIPVYSGFDRFCLMSMFNIRHFFDLCYNTFLLMDSQVDFDSLENFPVVSYALMHQGAINSSVSIIKEIPTYSPLGLTLSGLVNRLGDIFQIWQKGDAQSEPEKTHFYILNDFGDLPERIKEIIDQAKCWRVLIEYPATKDKNSNSSSGYEYQLNPIYAPYFSISFRKIRRLEFTGQRFLELCLADSEQYKRIRDEYIGQSKSTVQSSVSRIQNGLFDDLTD